jgi:putative transposase
MKRSRFTETQIVKALKEHENGRKVDEIARELGITPAGFYKWKERYGGMEVSDLKRLKELQKENAKLKRMFADLSLDHTVLKETLSKKGWGPTNGGK